MSFPSPSSCTPLLLCTGSGRSCVYFFPVVFLPPVPVSPAASHSPNLSTSTRAGTQQERNKMKYAFYSLPVLLCFFLPGKDKRFLKLLIQLIRYFIYFYIYCLFTRLLLSRLLRLDMVRTLNGFSSCSPRWRFNAKSSEVLAGIQVLWDTSFLSIMTSLD